MDCNFTTIKTCELKDSAFRSRILDFGDFDISDYTFSVVYKTGFDQIISEQELTTVGNILTVPLEAIESVSNRAKAEVWMLRDGGFKDKVIVFDVVISATGCPSDASITEGVSVTFGGLTVPVEVNQGIVNISREVAFSTLTEDEKLELKGEPGEPGEQGEAGPPGQQGDPLTFSDLTTEQVNELKQPAIDAAAVATTAATNADTAAGLATDATVEAVTATGQAIAATAQAENAAENANEAAEAANEAAANNMARYNDAADTLATDVIRRVDDGTKIEQEYKQTTTNIDGVAMTDAMVDGFMYLKRGAQYYINSDFAINRKVYLDSYGLPGDDTFRTIASHFPDVTLADVQELDPTATLSNSADWYMIMWLLRNLPVNSTIVLTGRYIIDREITFSRSHITLEGGKFKFSEKYAGKTRPYVRQITHGQHCFRFVNGDGIHDTDVNRIQNVQFKHFDIIGTILGDGTITGDGIAIDITLGDMIFCFFTDIRLYRNRNGLKHYTGHVNQVYFSDIDCAINYDCGMWWNGTPQSQTNLLGFKNMMFGANGLIIKDGVLLDYNVDIDGADYTKGGMSFGNLSATHIGGTATQENRGFGIMFRQDTSVVGVTVDMYGEGDQLGSLVVLCYLSSDLVINSSAIHTVSIYPEINDAFIWSSFASEEHRRKFVPSVGVAHNRQLHNLPWSENLITDAKNRTPFTLNGDYIPSFSRDELGSLVTTIAKQPVGGATSLEWFAYEDWGKAPYNLEEGDLVSFSFDLRFDLITGDDLTEPGIGNFGNMRYFDRNLRYTDAEGGVWTRIHFTHEHKGIYASNLAPRPYLYMVGSNPITFSVRNPDFRIKSKKTVFAESAPNATPLLKGVVNQAAAVADSTAVDITEMNTKYNELLTKLRAAGIVAP